jgi:hypothetical protein
VPAAAVGSGARKSCIERESRKPKRTTIMVATAIRANPESAAPIQPGEA